MSGGRERLGIEGSGIFLGCLIGIAIWLFIALLIWLAIR